MSDHWTTHMTLIQRAKDPNDENAWGDFVHYYKGFIHVVLHKMNFDIRDFDDVTQEILTKIWKYLSSFDAQKHQVKFRTWLSTLIRNNAIDFIRKKQRYLHHKEKIGELQLEDQMIISTKDLEDFINHEWVKYMTTKAMNNIQSLFSGVAVQAFEMSLDGKSTKEIGEKLKIKPDSARTLKNRVKSRLILEISELRKEMEF